jgi:hypothetical protein
MGIMTASPLSGARSPCLRPLVRANPVARPRGARAQSGLLNRITQDSTQGPASHEYSYILVCPKGCPENRLQY